MNSVGGNQSVISNKRKNYPAIFIGQSCPIKIWAVRVATAEV
jgi:hypothetical protein